MEHTFFLSLLHLIMANDYDLEATELLETYGEDPYTFCSLGTNTYFLDFLMKYIIIGTRIPAYIGIPNPQSILGEAGTGKTCLLHQFTHNNCS